MVVKIVDDKLPFGGSWLYEIDEVNGKTIIRITENGEVYNPFYRFVSRFIIRHNASIEQYLTNLKLASQHDQ